MTRERYPTDALSAVEVGAVLRCSRERVYKLAEYGVLPYLPKPHPSAWPRWDRSLVDQTRAVYGDDLPTRRPVVMRLWDKVAQDGTGCWLWTGHLDQNGYGCIRAHGHFYTHRLMYEQVFGRIPFEQQLDHLCRRPPCLNPWHLDPVSQSINLYRRYLAAGITPGRPKAVAQ